MNTYKEPILNDYRNSEFLQYMKDVVKLVNAFDVTSLGLAALRDALTIHTEALATAFEQNTQHSYTKVLETLDAQRDQLFLGIKYVLQGNTYHFDAVKQEAAKRLLFHMQSYGKRVTRANYQAQTAIIDSMLADWNTESNLQEAVTLLKLTEWITRLQEVNREFNEHYIARVSDTAANPMVSFYSLRTDAKTSYRSLLAAIRAYQTLNANEAYAAIYHKIFELARQYNQVVKMRRKASKRSVEEE